jgi:hypothetical protein
MIQKRCSKCGTPKDVKEFHKNKSCKDGLQWWCKECRKRESKEHREAISKRHKKYNEEHIEEISKRNKEYYKNHKKI